MRRREFITFVGCVAATWPLAARAQQPTATTHRLGLLFATSERGAKARGLLEAVTQGLKEYGWVEGQNITIEYRFADGKAVSSYVGMIPAEASSGGKRQRLGELTKQGNAMLRFLWCECVRHAVRHDAELKRFYTRKLAQKGLAKATVATGRKLGIRLWIMLRDEVEYDEFCRRGRQCGEAHAERPAR